MWNNGQETRYSPAETNNEISNQCSQYFIQVNVYFKSAYKFILFKRHFETWKMFISNLYAILYKYKCYRIGCHYSLIFKLWTHMYIYLQKLCAADISRGDSNTQLCYRDYLHPEQGLNVVNDQKLCLKKSIYRGE